MTKESQRIRNEVSTGHQIRIINSLFSEPIVGHLPEEFGFGVGSEFSEPFSSLIPDGGTGGLIARSVAGVSLRHGLIGEKFYSGSEPSEISFDLQFNSFYSAFDEVVLPTLKLLMLAVGKEGELLDESHKQEIQNEIDQGELFNSDEEINQKLKEWVSDFNLSFFISHDTSTIRFGDVFTLNEVYIQNVDFTFTNVMEEGANGKAFPVQANVSVSAIFKKPPAQEKLGEFFGATNSRIGVIEE